MKLAQRLINSQYKVFSLHCAKLIKVNKIRFMYNPGNIDVLVCYANTAMQTSIHHFKLHTNVKQYQVIHGARQDANLGSHLIETASKETSRSFHRTNLSCVIFSPLKEIILNEYFVCPLYNGEIKIQQDRVSFPIFNQAKPITTNSQVV